MHRPVVILALFLLAAGCGTAEEKEPVAAARREAGTTPKATLDAVRESLLASDFDSLYELNSKKEREESEARWDAARRDPQKRGALERFAVELGRSVEDVAAMPLRDLFAARNARQMSTPEAAATVASIEYRSAKELAPGQVMVTHGVRDRDQEMPMVLEDGRWYVWRLLTALTDF